MKSNKVIQFIIAIAVLLLITFGASQYQAVKKQRRFASSLDIGCWPRRFNTYRYTRSSTDTG